MQPLSTFFAIIVFLFISVTTVNGADYLAEFDGPEVSWQIGFRSQQDAQIAIHQRRRGMGRVGGAEFIRINTTRENTSVRLEHELPAATVLDELEASLWVKSNHEGFSIALTINLPEVIDPETKTPRTLLIVGDQYRTPGQWQQLKCRTTDRIVRDQLRLRRALNQISGQPNKMYVDRVILDAQLPPGTTDLQLDDLALSPVVRFQTNSRNAEASPIQQVNQTTDDGSGFDTRTQIPVKFNLHRLEVSGRPFFPRIITYHKEYKERPEVLSSAGINVAWVSDYEDTSVTGPLRRQGLWVTAAPPFAKGTDGEPLDSDDASLYPFGTATSPVLFWMLGARMTLDGRPRISSWTNQIRDADRAAKRPIAADVIENERLASRHVDLLGISRHTINSTFTLSDYRDWMIQRRDQAWPDSFCWTWIQTEVVPTLSDLSRGLESRPMLEPEQIRLQVYAALAAGCRGLGFWTTTPLDDDSPAARERLLTITQLNLELELYKPWIASGGKPELVSFVLETPRNESSGSMGKNKVAETSNKLRDVKAALAKRPREMQAAMFGSGRGALLLPMWLEENSQFVPGPLAARNISIIVPGGGATAAAWEITTTGRLRHLDREPAAGGVKIRLPRLDQTTAILITSDQSLVEELNQKIAGIQEQSAHLLVELAKLKLDRIRQVDQLLQNLEVGSSDAWRLLGEARQHMEKAESALQAKQMDDARQHASEALQYGRFLQRNHWEHATRTLTNPTTSPWAVSFQSLPEHWSLMRRLEKLGSLDAMENLLPSGEFEDLGTLVAEHWKHQQTMLETIQSSAELYQVAKQGKYSLRLSANPIAGEPTPTSISNPPVTVVSPGISVHAGQYVRVTGWAKIPAPINGSFDGALIYDSLLGKSGAVRLKAVQDWQRFELLRPVPETQELTITISLQGLGELLVDDLRITAFELGPNLPTPSTNKSTVEPAKYSPLDLRRLNPLQKRR